MSDARQIRERQAIRRDRETRESGSRAARRFRERRDSVAAGEVDELGRLTRVANSQIACGTTVVLEIKAVPCTGMAARAYLGVAVPVQVDTNDRSGNIAPSRICSLRAAESRTAAAELSAAMAITRAEEAELRATEAERAVRSMVLSMVLHSRATSDAAAAAPSSSPHREWHRSSSASH